MNIPPFFPRKPPAKLGILAAALLSPCCNMSCRPAYRRAGGHRRIWPSSLYICFLYCVRTGQYLRRNGPLNIFEHDFFLNPENWNAQRRVVLKRHWSKFVREKGFVRYRTPLTPVLYVVTEVRLSVCVCARARP